MPDFEAEKIKACLGCSLPICNDKDAACAYQQVVQIETLAETRRRHQKAYKHRQYLIHRDSILKKAHERKRAKVLSERYARPSLKEAARTAD